MIIIKIAASAFSCAYSWVFDPSLVSHSISPKNLSDGEHEEQQQRPGQQHQQSGQPLDRVAHHQPESSDAGSANMLYAKFNKCEFWLTHVAFLGHVISARGV
jgi:hypothetical protein